MRSRMYLVMQMTRWCGHVRKPSPVLSDVRLGQSPDVKGFGEKRLGLGSMGCTVAGGRVLIDAVFVPDFSNLVRDVTL